MKIYLVYVPVTEWDLGLSGCVYTVHDDCKSAIIEAHKKQGLEDDPYDCFKEGLYMIETWEMFDGTEE